MAEKRKLTTVELERITKFRSSLLDGSAPRPVFLTLGNSKSEHSTEKQSNRDDSSTTTTTTRNRWDGRSHVAHQASQARESSMQFQSSPPSSVPTNVSIQSSATLKIGNARPSNAITENAQKHPEQVECEYTVGIDEAGRGCILGPMFAGIVVWKTSKLQELRKMGVKDSKKLTRKKLGELHKLILEGAEYAQTVHFTAKQLNEMKEDIENPQTMNTMDEMLFARALDELPERFVDSEKPKLALYLDAADQIQERFGRSVVGRVKEDRSGMFGLVVSEHKADDTYPIVSAASIMAKFAREKWCDETHALYGEFNSKNFGTGYCNPQTLSWLKSYRIYHGAFPDICRKWKPCQEIEKDIVLLNQ